tara:strand:+ start:888 stop:1622 length:735 start_codon:yes stop_codon:yes gene_type:complete
MGEEYYTISGYINSDVNDGGVPNVMSEEVIMPYAPMNLDRETYTGKCAIWLKKVDIRPRDGIDHSLSVRGTLAVGMPTIAIRGLTSQNHFGLTLLKGATSFPGGSICPPTGGQFTTGHGGAMPVLFPFTFNEGHMDLTADLGDLAGDVVATGVVGSGSGTTDADIPSARHIVPFNNFHTTYINSQVGNPATANICSNIWGSNLTIDFLKGDLSNGTSSRFRTIGLKNPIYYELVVKPLIVNREG